MIESTASRGAGVTSSRSGTLSTRQLGAKHSITKRFIHGPRREVRVALMAHPRRVRAVRAVLSSLVARGLTGHFPKESPQPGSWLKIYGCARANPSALRSLPCAPARASAPARPYGTCRGALGPAHQRRAGGGHGRQAERDRDGPSDGCAVRHQNDRDQGTAESRPADHLAHGVARRGAHRRTAALAPDTATVGAPRGPGAPGARAARGAPAARPGRRHTGGRHGRGRRPRRPATAPCRGPGGRRNGGATGRGYGHGSSRRRGRGSVYQRGPRSCGHCARTAGTAGAAGHCP